VLVLGCLSLSTAGVADEVGAEKPRKAGKPNNSAQRRHRSELIPVFFREEVVVVDLVDLAMSVRTQFVADLGSMSSFADKVRYGPRSPEPLVALSLASSLVLDAVRGVPTEARPLYTSASTMMAMTIAVMKSAMSEFEAIRALEAFGDALDSVVC
jgi:hypothetical protein